MVVVSEWLKEHAWKVCIRQRIGGSNPPSPPYLRKSSYESTGFLLICDPSIAGWRHSSQAPYPVYISAAPPANNTTIRLSILAKNFSEFNFAPLV